MTRESQQQLAMCVRVTHTYAKSRVEINAFTLLTRPHTHKRGTTGNAHAVTVTALDNFCTSKITYASASQFAA